MDLIGFIAQGTLTEPKLQKKLGVARGGRVGCAAKQSKSISNPEVILGHPGVILGHQVVTLGSSWVTQGSSWVTIGSSWVTLGVILGHCGVIQVHPVVN